MIKIFQELEFEDYKNARGLFRGFDYQIVVRAVIEGTALGKIWVDDPLEPKSGFMATSEGWFLAGNPDNDIFNQGLKDLVSRMILKRDFYSPVNPAFLAELFFHIDSDSWKRRFSDIFDIRPPLPSKRMHFTCSNVILDWSKRIPEGYTLHQVDSSFDADRYDFPSDVNQWIGESLEVQKDRGYGKCLVHGNKVVVWINSDGASGDECEIGIFTTKDYRLKGLGSATAAATVEHCLTSGYSLVGWHCDDINQGSIGVAKKVGFVKERDYVHYICMFEEAAHFAETGLRFYWDKQYDEAILEFEKGFKAGTPPIWSYVLAARSYDALGNDEMVEHYMTIAKERGWNKSP